MKLIIVESPSKATTIQKYVGNDYIVEATSGHIRDLAKGGNKGIGVDLNNDFKPFYSIIKDKIGIVDKLIRETEKVSEILIAADPDREGESIAYHIQNILISSGKPISRVEFKEITKAGIKNGIDNRRQINMNLFHAQEARRILDRIVGFSVSPFLINNYGPNLSAGRVQSVVVRMIVDREREIELFKPEEYWNIGAKLENENKEQFISKFDGKIKNKKEAEAIVSFIKEKNDFYVLEVKIQKKNEKPQPPLITSKLQQYMAKKFGFDADRTMKAAQTLYESGYCTYIRTDSIRIAEEVLSPTRKWLNENGFDIPKNANQYSPSGAAQDAHECIRPTNVSNTPDSPIFSNDEKIVYRAIWQHFLASQMNPAVWNTLSVKMVSKSNPKLGFRSSGKALEYKGYLEIFGEVDSGSIEIPNLKKGDGIKVILNSIKSEQKFTQPPPRFNKFSILKELEDRKIGRPSTYAEIIKKISNRHYVELNGNTYKPTEVGKKITDILVKFFPFMEYEYTAMMEKKLDDIASGSLEELNMLKDFYFPFKEKLDKAYVGAGAIICDKCGSPMTKRKSKFDQMFLGCTAYPKCMYTKNFDDIG